MWFIMQTETSIKNEIICWQPLKKMQCSSSYIMWDLDSYPHVDIHLILKFYFSLQKIVDISNFVYTYIINTMKTLYTTWINFIWCKNFTISTLDKIKTNASWTYKIFTFLIVPVLFDLWLQSSQCFEFENSYFENRVRIHMKGKIKFSINYFHII